MLALAGAALAVPFQPLSAQETASSSISLPASSVSSVVTPPSFDPEAYGLAAAYAMVPKTRRELFAWQADTPWPIASLTKLFSAYLWHDRTVPWGRLVSMQARDEVGGGRLRVAVGSVVRFEDLWYASITASANNSAMSLARQFGLSAKQVVALMNQEAKKAGAKTVVFADPSGMDPANVASARDLALLADRAFAWRPLQKAASTMEYVVRVVSPKAKNHPVYTTNDLLRFDPDVWVIAGKTGYLDESRHNLVAWMRPVGVDGKPEAGKDVLVVVYGAPSRERMFAAAKALAQSLWNSDAFARNRPLPR